MTQYHYDRPPTTAVEATDTAMRAETQALRDLVRRMREDITAQQDIIRELQRDIRSLRNRLDQQSNVVNRINRG